MKKWRVAAVIVLAAIGVAGLGAKCIENDSLRRDRSGDWLITGEIHNETDVQGLDMVLTGRIEFADGTAREAPADVCPPGALSPGTFSVYAIKFKDTADMPRPVRHSVNVSSGRASSERLRTLLGQFNDVQSSRPAPGSPILNTRADFLLENRERTRIRNNAGAFYNYCIALYSPDGDVVSAFDGVTEAVDPDATTLTVRHQLGTTPTDAVEARVFIYLSTVEGIPLTAPRITDAISITDPSQ